MKSKELAPIVLFVYNRPEHTKKTVEALKKNSEAKKSILYIFSDAPKKPEDEQKVKEVRDYIKNIKGFKQIKVKEREKNYGLSENLISAMNEVFKKHSRAIVLEDDDVPSKYFLKYMNDALELYDEEDKVGAISGYIYPIKKEFPETFFLNFFSSWGFGLWKRSWDLYDLDGRKLKKEIDNRNLKKLFNINNTYPFTRILRNQIKGNNDSWSIRFYASLLVNKKLVLYPKKSLISNIGFDNTGTHGQKRGIFETTTTQKPIRVEKIPLKQSPTAYKELQRYFKRIFWERLFSKIKRLFRHPLKELRNL